MGTKLYFAVKVACAIFIFYHLWVFIFCNRMGGIWDRLYYWLRLFRAKVWIYSRQRMRKVREARRMKSQAEEQKLLPPPPEDNDGVIGKTTVVFLEDPDAARKTPVHSEPLEVKPLEEDEEIDPDDVEMGVVGLSEEERAELMTPTDSEPDPDFTTAFTFEEIANVAEVLVAGTPDRQKAVRAAETIHHKLMATDILAFLTDKVSNQERVDRLLAEYLDGGGNPIVQNKPVRKEKEPFDIRKYT